MYVCIFHIDTEANGNGRNTFWRSPFIYGGTRSRASLRDFFFRGCLQQNHDFSCSHRKKNIIVGVYPRTKSSCHGHTKAKVAGVRGMRMSSELLIRQETDFSGLLEANHSLCGTCGKEITGFMLDL